MDAAQSVGQYRGQQKVDHTDRSAVEGIQCSDEKVHEPEGGQQSCDQIQMIDPALKRRFDLTLQLDMPDVTRIKALVKHVLSGTSFKFDDNRKALKLQKECVNMSYYIIQRTLITAIKRTILNMQSDIVPKVIKIDTSIWEQLIKQEKQG